MHRDAEDHHKGTADHQRNVDHGSRQEHFIGTDPFCAEPDEAVPEQIPEKHTSRKTFSAVRDQKAQEQDQAGRTFVQKSRRRLDIGGVPHLDDLFPHQVGHRAALYASKRKLHGQRVVCVLAERAPREQISPPGDDLGDQNAHGHGVCHLKERYPDQRAEKPSEQDPAKKCSVKRKSSFTNGKDLQKIVLIAFPVDCGIQGPRSDERTGRGEQKHAKAAVRILSPAF